MNTAITCVMLAIFSSERVPVAEVRGVIATNITFTEEVSEKVVSAVGDLLASCTFSREVSEEDWQKSFGRCHLHVKFATPRLLLVDPTGKLEVKEMIITFPLTSGGVWLQSGDHFKYFAKFAPKTTRPIQLLLKEAVVVN